MLDSPRRWGRLPTEMWGWRVPALQKVFRMGFWLHLQQSQARLMSTALGKNPTAASARPWQFLTPSVKAVPHGAGSHTQQLGGSTQAHRGSRSRGQAEVSGALCAVLGILLPGPRHSQVGYPSRQATQETGSQEGGSGTKETGAQGGRNSAQWKEFCLPYFSRRKMERS